MTSQFQGPRHIAVIGAGIIGVCTALYLQRDGHRVTLIDRRRSGRGRFQGQCQRHRRRILRARGHARHPEARARHAAGPAGAAGAALGLSAETGALALAVRPRLVAGAGGSNLHRAPCSFVAGAEVLLAADPVGRCPGHDPPHRLADRLRDRREVPGRAGRSGDSAPPRRRIPHPAAGGDPPARAEPGADLQARHLPSGERLCDRQFPAGAGAGGKPGAQRRKAGEGGGHRFRLRYRRPPECRGDPRRPP